MKIFLFIRNAFVLIGWTFVFLLFSNVLIDAIWHFDFLSNHSWSVLDAFWNNGGILKTTSDILLMTSLLILPFLWLVGFILVRRLNFLKIFLFPFDLLSRPFRSDDTKEPQRIVLKNLKSSQQTTEDLKAEIEEAAKPKKTKEAEDIRSEIIQKRTMSNK
ncbi:MAG: hypothetical protein MJ210_05200 [Alphaproteobacteria bacterium]|nr:hypothetical protein [Alphaproteobacteria bacterium]